MANNYFDYNNFEFNRNYSISASAGTGKTFSIIKIVDKLLKKGIKEDELLIVTYTEKAAGELKARIKKEIPQFDIDNAHIGTIHSFCKDTISEYYFTMGLPKDLILVDDSKMQGLYERFIRDSLYNGTIKLENIKKLDKKDLMEIVKKLYLDLNYEIDPNIVSIEKKPYFEVYFNNISNLNGKTEKEIIDFFLNFNDPNDLDLTKEIHYLFNEFKEEIYYNEVLSKIHLYEDEITNIKEELKKLNKKNLSAEDTEKKEKYKKTKAEKDKKIKEFKEILEQLQQLKNSLIENISTTGKFNYNFKGRRINKYLDIVKKIVALTQKKRAIESYEEKAIELYIKWQELKRHNKWFSFDDMLREVREAVISNTGLREKLCNKYKYALIDEFQDTNQIQWDIFKTVFLDNKDNHIIVVGDRKQSIYSFQGADLTVYDSAVKAIEKNGGYLQVLPKNYRSSKPAIDAYNRLFKVKSFASLDYSDVDLGHPHLDAKFDGNSIKGLSVVMKEEHNEIQPVLPHEYAQMLVKMISDYCTLDKSKKTRLQLIDNDGNANNVSFKDFMILGKTRSELYYIENELKKAGIPYVKYKDTKLFGGIECNHWIALLNAILVTDFTGKNRNIFRKALFTKFFDISLPNIASPYYDTDSTDEMMLLLKWKGLASEYKYVELINSIIEDSRIEQRMSSLTDIQSLNVFKQIADYSLGYLLDGNSLYELKNNLIRLNKGEKDDEDGSIVQKGTDFDCVELMTMHASKGLDRAIVFSVGGEKKKNNNLSTVGIYHKEEVLDNGSSETRAYITMDSGKYAKEESEEFERLFYVAYTRHKYLLVIPYYQENDYVKVVEATKEFIEDENNNDYFEKVIFEENKIDISNIKKNIKEIIKNKTTEVGSKELKDKQITRLEKMAKNMYEHNLYKHSYASMSKINDNHKSLDTNLNVNKEGNELEEILSGFDKSAIPVELAYSNNNPESIPASFPKGALIGTALHEIFENFEFTEINNANNNLKEVIEDRFNANNIKLDNDFIDYVTNIVKNVLNAKLPKIKGNTIDTANTFKLSEISSIDRKAEAEFNFALKNNDLSNYCNGFIDLLFKQGEYYSILDWKSDTLNSNDLLSYNKLEDIKKRVDGHYSIQRVLYSYTLVNWLSSCYHCEPEEVFNNHFGGIYYVFIRGCNVNTSNGIYAQTWNSYSDLKKEFDFIMKKVTYSGKGGKSND